MCYLFFIEMNKVPVIMVSGQGLNSKDEGQSCEIKAIV